MAAEEVPRVVGFACLQALAPAAARPSRDEQPVSPLAALLARQGQAFRRPLVVRTRRPEADGAFRARSLQLEIRGEVGPDHGSSASAPSSVSTPAIAIPETARAVPPPAVALEELAVELRASAEDAAGPEVTALLAMQHQLAQGLGGAELRSAFGQLCVAECARGQCDGACDALASGMDEPDVFELEVEAGDCSAASRPASGARAAACGRRVWAAAAVSRCAAAC